MTMLIEPMPTRAHVTLAVVQLACDRPDISPSLGRWLRDHPATVGG